MSHERLDRRALALHRAIAAKLRERPELLAIAEDNLDRWIAQGGRSAPYLLSWREILKRPLEEILTVMVEDSEKMTAMRQFAPFAGILDPKERWLVYDTVRIWNPSFERSRPSLTIRISSSSAARRFSASSPTPIPHCW